MALCNDNMPERVFDEVIVRDASRVATIHKIVHDSQSVYAHVLAAARLAPPYANDDECLALRGASWDASEWLRKKQDMKGCGRDVREWFRDYACGRRVGS